MPSSTSASGVRVGLGGFETTEPAEDVEVLDVVEVDLVGPALLAAVLIDERVREDLVEPRLQVRALVKAAESRRPRVEKGSWTRSSASLGFRVIRSAAA